MKIAVWGVGAVGIGLATALARTKSRIQLLIRSEETAREVASRGITRTGRFGEVRIPPEQIEVLRTARELREDPADWLLVCTKSHSTPAIASELEDHADRLTGTTRLLLCQNGWENETPFLNYWPTDRLFHARIITGFHKRTATSVEITAHAAAIALGSLYDVAPSLVAPLAERISKGGIPAEASADMRSVLWAKMLYNCALNPLGALAGRRYGEITSDPTTKGLLEDVVHEIFEVLAKAEIELAWPDARAYLETFYSELIPPTAGHESSMLQDLRAGKRTEIDALCGAVERLGAAHGVATPVTSALAVLVRAAESDREGESVA